MRAGIAVAIGMVLVALGGCLQPFQEYHEFDTLEQYRNPGVFPGSYGLGAAGSQVLNAGRYNATGPEIVRLVSNLPAYGEAAVALDDDAIVDIVMAIWRPFNITEKVPIIVDAGPYYEIDTHCEVPDQNPCQKFVDDTIDYPAEMTPANLANYLPHGYAVAQIAVRGTGTAGGCMDLLGPSEAHDLDQAITWLGTQEWSNGNIAMMGVSYDASTPWEVAGMGNPHLKTIVPISGLPDIYGLMFHNGSAENRGAAMHNQVYWGFGFDDEFPQRPDELPGPAPWPDPAGNGRANGREHYQDMQNLACAEVVEGSALGQYSAAGGDRGGQFSTYWTERDYRQRVIDNYEGSIFLVHGLQDWNVDPHAAIPFNQQLRDAGFEMKEWYGQWGHTTPDGTCAPRVPAWVVLPCRLDYAEVLLRWFDHYLKGNTTAELGPDIQVQDNLGYWRNAGSYPDRSVAWTPLMLSADGALVHDGAAAGQERLMPPGNNGPSNVLAFRSEPLETEMHLSGLPQLKLPFEAQGEGGQIAAWLFDEDPRGLVRAPTVAFNPITREWFPTGVPVIGHAQMNLLYHEGGDTPSPLVPGTRYTAQVEFEPLEVRVPAGHRLSLWVFQYHFEEHVDSPTRAPVDVFLGEEARLLLPVADVDTRTVFPVPGAHFRNDTYAPEMYVPYPGLPTTYTVPDPPAVKETPRAPPVSRPCVVCL